VALCRTDATERAGPPSAKIHRFTGRQPNRTEAHNDALDFRTIRDASDVAGDADFAKVFATLSAVGTGALPS